MDHPPLGRMTPYGTEHLLVLLLTLVAAVVLVRWARRGKPARVDSALRTAGWVLLINSMAWTVWGFLPGHWLVEESLPLHYSDFLRLVLSIALITQARWAVVISYFGGLTLNLQSVITPDLRYYDVVALEFVQYWVAHMSGLLVPVVLIWGLGYRPTWRGYGLAFLSTLAWALTAFTGNALTGANYGYLNRAPAGPSVLDLMGPWPMYLLVEAAAIAVVWALMTWPWVIHDRRLGTPLSGRGALTRRRPRLPSMPRAAVVRPQARSSTSASRRGP